MSAAKTLFQKVWDGHVVRAASDVDKGDELRVRLAEDELTATVEK